MRLTMRFSAITIGLALAAPLAHGDDLPEPIDLTSFGRVDGVEVARLDELGEEIAAGLGPGPDRAAPLPIIPVVHGIDSPATRVYVSGVVGASFATVSTGGNSQIGDTPIRQGGSVNETIFTGGGAIGLAFAKPSGLLRIEVEGRARGPMTGRSFLTADGEDPLPLDVTATNGWSTLSNFWRDAFLTESLGIYAGGGFGVGGYQYAMADTDAGGLTGSTSVTTFAWQAGTGIVYQVNHRVTIDTGYRFFAMTPQSTTLFIDGGPIAPMLGIGSFSSAFSASELLLSIRIYEPFRTWR